MEFDEYIKMINGRVSIFIFGSILFALFWPRPASAKLILGPSGTITPFVVSLVYETPSSNTGGAWNDGVSVTPPARAVRERLQDAVGRLQSIASRMRGAIQDTRSYTQVLARERGVDVGTVERVLARAEDQLSRADAQVITLSQLTVEIDAGTSDEMVLSHAKTQLRLIKTALLSGRDGLRVALDELRTLHQQPTPTSTGIPDRVTGTPTP